MAAPNAPIGTSGNTTLTYNQLSQTTNIGNLHKKVAIVTGASSGLGRAIAQAYAAAGAYVVNADLTSNPPPVPHLSAQDEFKAVDLTTPTVDLINRQFANAENVAVAAFVHCNVTDPTSMEAAIAFAAKTYGRLDIIVNNAGIAAEATSRKRFHEQDISIIDKDLAVNVKGVMLGCKYAIAQMLAQPPLPSGERGWIINMSSIAGFIGLKNSGAYCASKGAVLAFSKSLALDYARDHIHVNTIHPGFAETSFLESMKGDGPKAVDSVVKLHPWGRLAHPEDIAKMAVFLAGDGASFITGAQFVVDGGYTAQ